MARKRKPLSDAEQKARYQRAKDLQYLREGLRDVRKIYKGFEAADGFKLTDSALSRLSKSKLARAKKFIQRTRKELASPHKIVRARTKPIAEALYKHTGADRTRNRKAFIVHVAKPDQTEIRVETSVKKKGRKKVQVTEIVQVVGGEFRETYFYFADYLRSKQNPPKTMKGIMRLAKRMTKDMPEGYYVFLSRDHGEIGNFMEKRLLVDTIEIRWLKYDRIPDLGQRQSDDRGLAESLIGFKFISSTVKGAEREFIDRTSRRRAAAKARKRIAESKRDRIRRRLTGRR